ncbi:MAG: hypothetical protein LPJ98_10985, partial [Cyclobacteriaceae bacterium]|nr:hypothetical protein [Cyclobacteriaceae bacterium]
MIKPLIDTSWDITLGGISIIEVFSTIFLFYAYVFIKRNSLFSIIPNFLIVLWYLAHMGIVISLFLDPVNGLKSLLKMLYFPISLVLLPYFLLFSASKQGEKTLKFLIYGAVFSSLISIFQFVGIIPYEYEHTSKGLQRANGFYHDMVTSRMYVIQGLLALAYIQLSGRYILRSRISWTFLFIFVLAGYSLFSKALIGIFVVGIFLLILT